MTGYRLKLLLPDADHSIAEIIVKVEEVLLEDGLQMGQRPGHEASAGTSLQDILKAACGKQMSETSSDGTNEDDQGETCLSDSSPPRGIGSNRKRTKRVRSWSAAKKNQKRAEVGKELLMLENGKTQVAVAQEQSALGSVPMPVKILVLVVFVFVIFMHVIKGC